MRKIKFFASFVNCFFILLSGHIVAQDLPFSEPIKHLSAHVAGKTGGAITIDEFLETGELSLSKDSISDMRIVAFKLTVVYRQGGPLEFEGRGSGKFTEEMRSAIKDSYTGCNIFFEFIKCSSGKKLTGNLPPLSFKIID